MRECHNGLFRIVHAHQHSRPFEIIHTELRHLPSILGHKLHLKLSCLSCHKVCRLILVPKGVSPYDNRLGPSRHEPWDILYHNRLPKDGPIELVPDGSIGRFPHLFQVEFFHSVLIGGDCGTLYANLVLLYSSGCIQRHLVSSLVSMLDAQVEVEDVEIQEGKDQLVLDHAPNDASHLVTIHLHNRVRNLYLLGSLFHYSIFIFDKSG